MIANVVKGGSMYGLVQYLAGEGKANEHESPHIVAGDDFLTAWHGSDVLERASVKDIADYLDGPRRDHGTTVKARIYEFDEETGERRTAGYRDAHVWHCSLSLRAEEGRIGDAKWQSIASDFMDRLGFTEASGKAPARWVAIHHGLSAGGNDHIHIAGSLVREDGTRWEGRMRDWEAVRDACRELEVKYELEVLESAEAERGTRGYVPVEQRKVEAEASAIARRKYEEQARESGQPATDWDELTAAQRRPLVTAEAAVLVPRRELARTVRGAATASLDEAEFVRRLRAGGVLVRPRFAEGRTDVVAGYSVALRPAKGDKAVWYGGGRLGRDLTLPRLREEWAKTGPEHEVAAVEASQASVAEWAAARRGDRITTAGREATEAVPQAWDKAAGELERLNKILTVLPLEDRETWARIARDTAGVFSAWSKSTEAQPGPYAAAADALSASAQTFKAPQQPRPKPLSALSGAALLAASAAKGGKGTAAERALLRQLMTLTIALADVAAATGQARQAAALVAVERDQLRRVHDALPSGGGEGGTTATRTRPKADLTAEQQAVVDRLAQTRGTQRPGQPGPQKFDGPTHAGKPITPPARDERSGFDR